MPDPTWIHSANLGLRAGVVALLLLLAAVLLRDHGRAIAARLGALCAVGSAVYAICAAPDPTLPALWWHWPMAALTTGNSVVFWLLSRALFDDGFKLRPRHGLAWAAMAGAGLLNCGWLRPGQPGGDALGVLILLATLACSVLAVGQSLATWSADLVEGRRRLRVFIVAGGAAYTLLNTGTRLVLHPSPTAELPLLIDALGLAMLIAPIVWQLVGGSRGELFPVPGEAVRPSAHQRPAGAVVDAPALGRQAVALREPAPLGSASHEAASLQAASLEVAFGRSALHAKPAAAAADELPGQAPIPVLAPELRAPADSLDLASMQPMPADGFDPADAGLAQTLVDSMESERLYREEGLTIGALAQRLGVPEHRLRRLINQRLGHRNFNQYLNGYRLAEAKAALADSTQDDVPVLAIAMDAGFQSLGPFNRAFKADTGMTPSEYRRMNSHAQQSALPSKQPSPQWRGASA